MRQRKQLSGLGTGYLNLSGLLEAPVPWDDLGQVPDKRRKVVVQSLSHVGLSATPWTAAHQASLSFTTSRSLLKLMSTESVMPSNHLILCCPLSSCPQSFPVSSPMSRLFTSGSPSIADTGLADYTSKAGSQGSCLLSWGMTHLNFGGAVPLPGPQVPKMSKHHKILKIKLMINTPSPWNVLS